MKPKKELSHEEITALVTAFVEGELSDSMREIIGGYNNFEKLMDAYESMELTDDLSAAVKGVSRTNVGTPEERLEIVKVLGYALLHLVLGDYKRGREEMSGDIEMKDVSGTPRPERDIEAALQCITREMVENMLAMSKRGEPLLLHYTVIRDALRELLHLRKTLSAVGLGRYTGRSDL